MNNDTRVPIIWYEWYYEVSNNWNVRSVKRSLTKKQKKMGSWDIFEYTYEVWWKEMSYVYEKWYKRVPLVKDKVRKMYLVHRIVYCSFNNINLIFKWYNTNVICHKDDNKLNNNISNLYEWSQMDNIRDAEKNWKRNNLWAKIWQWIWKIHTNESIMKRSKLNVDQILEIRKNYTNKDNLISVWKIYWVSNATISRVLSNLIRNNIDA